MGRADFLAVFLLCLIVAGWVLPVAAQDDTQALGGDYKGFWYSEVTNEKGKTRLEREVLDWEEFKRRRQNAVDDLELKYTAFLNGDYAYAEPEIPEAKAQAMVQMDSATSQRIGGDPEYLGDVANRMAEWSIYYNQLSLWSKFVEESVLRETLTEEEKPSFDLTVIDTELADVYENLKERAKKIADRQWGIYQRMVSRILANQKKEEQYQDWLAEREQDIVDFAKKWQRRYEGKELNIAGTTYLIQGPEDAASGAGADSGDEKPAGNTVVISVVEEGVITPFDLLDSYGALKKPAD